MGFRLERFFAPLGRVVFYALMGLGVWLMFSASLSYVELGQEHPFLLEKLPLARPGLFVAALYVHVPTALVSLPACLLLLLKGVRAHFPALHRWLGRVTGVLVLFAVVPSGMYLAFFAQGGLITAAGFWLTGLIAFFAMLRSIRAARARDFRAHRRFSLHVVAQLSVAVFSRFMLVAAEQLGMYDEWVYVAALYVPVIGCALVVELLTGAAWLSMWKGTRYETLASASRPDAVR